MCRPIYLLAFVLLSYTALTQPSRDFKVEASALRRAFDEHHFSPPTIDDAFSAATFESLLNRLDPAHLYFNQEDISNLQQYQNLLDNEWNQQQWSFLPQITTIYRRALERSNLFLQMEGARNINWQAETFHPDGAGLPWQANDLEQQNRWRLWIKYKALSRGAHQRLLDSAAVKNDDFFNIHEKDLRQKVVGVETRRISRILQNPEGFESYVADAYFNSITAFYDPHSLYFSPTGFLNYKAGVSTKKYSFGIRLQEDADGNVLLEQLVPGGPAWKSGELHAGDMLLAMAWEGQPPFDLTGIGLDEFVDLLDRANPFKMTLTVKSSNGLIKTVSLLKDKVESEENIIKGFVLKGSHKVGYISLPGFYTRWDSDESSSCAVDVAKEIIKLKGESIDGLILDIRSNHGGSLSEALDLLGIFIDQGPLAIVQVKGSKARVIIDQNRGSIYDGPLVLMINGQSASASEVLAGTLQDYHRGVIIGGSSYGKATGQVACSLDTVGSKGPNKGFGFATITDLRLYRVTGKSNQAVGITPDIALPDIYDIPGFREGSMARFFTNDSIVKKVYMKELQPLPLQTLLNKSLQRRKGNMAFSQLELIRSEIVDELNKEHESLELKPGTFTDQANATSQAGLNVPYTVTSPTFDKVRMETDTYFKEFTQYWTKYLITDPYVEEAFHVATDLIQLVTR